MSTSVEFEGPSMFELFLERTEDVVRLSSSLDAFIGDCGQKFQGMASDIGGIHERIGNLEKVLITGNGEPSIRDQVRSHGKELGTLGEKKKEGVGARWAFYAAAITAVGALVSTLVIGLADSSSDADRLQAEEVRQILQIVRQEERMLSSAPILVPAPAPPSTR
jgi:hypothetical protein